MKPTQCCAPQSPTAWRVAAFAAAKLCCLDRQLWGNGFFPTSLCGVLTFGAHPAAAASSSSFSSASSSAASSSAASSSSYHAYYHNTHNTHSSLELARITQHA